MHLCQVVTMIAFAAFGAWAGVWVARPSRKGVSQSVLAYRYTADLLERRKRLRGWRHDPLALSILQEQELHLKILVSCYTPKTGDKDRL
jgi:hypothetical protein